MILDPDWLVSAFKLCHLDVGCLVFVTNSSHREKPFSPSFVYIWLSSFGLFSSFSSSTQRKDYIWATKSCCWEGGVTKSFNHKGNKSDHQVMRFKKDVRCQSWKVVVAFLQGNISCKCWVSHWNNSNQTETAAMENTSIVQIKYLPYAT